MNKSRLASFIDSCIIAIITLVFGLIIFGSFLEDMILKILLSSIISAFTFMFYLKREKRKYYNQQLKLKEENLARNYNNCIKFMDSKSKIAFFTNLFTRHAKKNNITNFGYNTDNIQGYNNQKLLQNIIDKLNKNNYSVFYIVVRDQESNFQEIINYVESKKINAQIVTSESLYLIMKATNYFPPLIISNEITSLTKTQKLKNFFHALFKRKNAKSFLAAGLSLLFLKLFVPFSSHYLYFGCAFLVLALISLIIGKDRSGNKTA